MTFLSFRTISAIALTALLTACGAGQQDTQGSMQMSSAMQSDFGAPAPAAANATSDTGANATAGAAVFAAAPNAAATGPAVAAAAGPNHPAPDCAADGCASLRIIDGNAEAFRIDAMRRAAADGV